MKSKSASVSLRTEAPLPAQMAHDLIWMSSTEEVCGMATGKPLGEPTPRAMRSMRWVRGWGESKRTRRPIPELGGMEVEGGRGWITERVWEIEEVFRVGSWDWDWDLEGLG